jgi:hypothetical protein
VASLTAARLGDLDRRVLAAAAGGPLLLVVARILPDDGFGLGLRLFAAAFCLLVLPGGLVVRAVGWPEVPATALAASVAVSLGLAFFAFAITFAVGGTLWLTVALIVAAGLVALVPAARARPEPAEALEARMLLGVLVAGVVLGAIAWWVAHSLGTGDVLFHLARARKIADADHLSSVGVANEFRDGGLHPGYAFPLWHGILALVARLAGVDVTAVVLHFGSALVPLAFAASYAAGRALFGHWAGGVAALAAQVAQLGFSRGGTGTYQSIALPSSLARALLVPLVLALLFAYLRERDRRLLVWLGCAALALAVIHPTYLILVGVPLLGFAVVWLVFGAPRRQIGVSLGLAFLAVAIPAGLFFAWLGPTVADTASYRPGSDETARALAHYGNQLQAMGDGYRAAPDAVTRGGPVVVAALLLLPLAAFGVRRRWGALAAGGTLLTLAVLLVPELFTRFSDLLSISQARRLAQFLPVPFVLAAAAVVAGRARIVGVAAALGIGIALEVAYSADLSHVVEEAGPVWPLWVAVIGTLAVLVAAAFAGSRLDPIPDPSRWAAFMVLALVLPVAVDGLRDLDRADADDPYALTPGLVAALDRLPGGGVVLAPVDTSYRIAAYAPVFVVATPAAHAADTKQNRPYRRQRDVLRFFARGVLDDAERKQLTERYGAGWLVVDKTKPYPRDLVRSLPHVYEDGRYLLVRTGVGSEAG